MRGLFLLSLAQLVAFNTETVQHKVSDSLSALTLLKTLQYTHCYTKNTARPLHNVRGVQVVPFCSFSKHTGIGGNKFADFHAKLASTQEQFITIHFHPFPNKVPL